MRRDGFTIIELMIVIAILGILLALAMPAYDEYKHGKRRHFLICGSATGPVSMESYRRINKPDDNVWLLVDKDGNREYFLQEVNTSCKVRTNR